MIKMLHKKRWFIWAIVAIITILIGLVFYVYDVSKNNGDGILIFVKNHINLASGQKIESMYTSLNKGCIKTSENTSLGAPTVCKGIEGYDVLVEDDDLRMSVVIRIKDGKEYDQNYYGVVTGHFSYLGETAEWRILNKNGVVTPIGLIIKVDAYEYIDNPDKFNSYYAISKITPDQICVTDKFIGSLIKARQLADNAKEKSCLASN